VPVSTADREAAIAIASRLRAAGFAADLMLKDQSVGKGLKAAAQSGARTAIMVGERERAEGRFTVRNLKTGGEMRVTAEEIVGSLR
ncbi:MAG: histidine--tRNA ligase, partial [Gemmatimonadetes bacterium]|nr:histidine--tRNA ligase [Gemmatimonadota bacterium]